MNRGCCFEEKLRWSRLSLNMFVIKRLGFMASAADVTALWKNSAYSPACEDVLLLICFICDYSESLAFRK